MERTHTPVGLTQAAAHLAVVRLTLSIIVLAAVILIGAFYFSMLVLHLLHVPEGALHEFYEIVLTCALGLPPLFQVTLRPVARLAAEHASAAAESRFQAIAQATHDGIVIFDQEGFIQFANTAIEQMHGFAANSLRGKSLELLLPDESRQVLREELKAFGRGEDNRILGKGPTEEAGLRASGERFVVEISVSALGKNRNSEFVVVVRDITARKQVEREIQERTTRLNALIANSPLAIVVSDKNMRVQMANTAFEELFQYRSAEIAGLETDSLVAPPELLQEALRISERSMRGEVSHTITRRRRKDGTLVDVELHAVPLLIDGQVEGGYGIYQDLTERKRAEEAVRQSEANLKTILESLPVAVRIIRDSKIAFANAADARLHGYESPADELGLDSNRSVAEEELVRLADYAKRRVAGEDAPRQYTALRRKRDGTEFQAQMHAERILYDGAPVSLLVIQDLTDQNRLRMYEQILPVCCVCGKIRDDYGVASGEGAWDRLDHYIARHTEAKVSHTFCPACLKEYRKREGLPSAESSTHGGD